jgi:UDP-N-acetylglucosamine acyltransferase
MIHDTAVIESGAQIGENVAIGPFCYVASEARIGDGCVLGPHVTVHAYTEVGPACRVHAGAVLGDLPQDLGYEGGVSRVRIGEGCVIREGVTVHRGTKPDSETVIGAGCFLMAFSHFAHNVRLGDAVIVANGALLAGYVEVGARAFVSGNVVIHQFVKVGRLSMLGGGAAVPKDVPPFCTVKPASLGEVVGLNVVGLRRAGFDSAERANIKQAFKLMYRSGLNVKQAVEAIRAEIDAGPGLEIADFADASERGICGYVA